jgi:hypothetical protein
MSREAVIYPVNYDGDFQYWGVHLIEDGVLKADRWLPGKSLHYAEDVAENWENGIIQIGQ